MRNASFKIALTLLFGLSAASPAMADQKGTDRFMEDKSLNATLKDADEAIPRIDVTDRIDPDMALAKTNAGLRLHASDVLISGSTRLSFNSGLKRYVMTLTGGELTTVINGKAEERAVGETWSIGRRQRVVMTTDDDTAIIDVLEFEPVPR
ncbi:MAG: hypothetical protein AAF439_14675 [Pseudomonadota bacterium]